MKDVTATKIHYIKLGRKQKWAELCIKSGILKFGYNYVNHKSCINGNWISVESQVTKWRKKQGRKFHKPTITGTVNTIKKFYEDGVDVMWVAFFGDNLWWCHAKPSIRKDSNNDKERKVKLKWSNLDKKGNPLIMDEISTAITKIKRYEGTISTFKEKESEKLLNLINCKKSKQVLEIQESINNLKNKIGSSIHDLHWKDFELLIDLIFRQGGWQRIKPIGGSEETFDLTLTSPITKEKILVQVKSTSDLKQFQRYQKKFKKMDVYHKKFYVVHTADKNLKNHKPRDGTILWTLDDVVEQVINLGLINWLVTKIS